MPTGGQTVSFDLNARAKAHQQRKLQQQASMSRKLAGLPDEEPPEPEAEWQPDLHSARSMAAKLDGALGCWEPAGIGAVPADVVAHVQPREQAQLLPHARLCEDNSG